MLYPQSAVSPFGVTPYQNVLNNPYGNLPQYPTSAQFSGLTPQHSSQQQAGALQPQYMLQPQYPGPQPYVGQPFAQQQLTPFGQSPIASPFHTALQPTSSPPHPQLAQAQALYQLAHYHYLLAQQIASLAAQQQQSIFGSIGGNIANQGLQNQQFLPNQQFGPPQQFIPGQFNPYGQNVAPGMTLH